MNLKEKIKSLSEEIQNSPEIVKQKAESLREQCRKNEDERNEFSCLVLLSDTYTYLGNYPKAEEVLKAAEKLKVVSEKERAQLHNSLGNVYWYKGEYANALREYLDLMQAAEALSDDKLKFSAYNNIGMIYWSEGKYTQARSYYEKGLELLPSHTSLNAGNALNNIGLCYIREEDFDLAERYLQKALRIFENCNDQKLMANSYLNLANCQISTGKQTEGIKQIEKALTIKRQINDKWGICHCLCSLARLYFTEENLQKVGVLLEEGLQLCGTLEAKSLSKDCYEIGSAYYEEIGDEKKALELYKKYVELWQEKSKEENSQRIDHLVKGFEYKEKEKEAEIFRLRNIELKSKNELIESQKQELDNTLKELRKLNKNLKQEVSEKVEELRQKDQMLVVQSRQAALGEMIACIAHQWRQPLNGISLITQNLLDAWEFEEFDEKFLYKNSQSILDLVKFMNTTIEDFRNFYRTDLQASDFNLKDIVEKTLHFVEHSLKRHNINLDLDLNDIQVHGFPNYYSQVVINIINNAKDVLEERQIPQPKIRIKAYSAPRTRKSILTIEDNGGGIRKEQINKIFNPYFSTKGTEKGTGLGLYMSKVIIEKNMKGKITASNTPLGACFTIEV